jgi:TonB family protein
MSRKPSLRRRPLQFAFEIADATRLPLTGERHPLRREFAKWMSWANVATLLACISVFGVWNWWSHRESVTAPVTRQVKIVRYADLGVPPSLARMAAPQMNVAQAVSEIVAPPPTIAVPEPVADELAQVQTIASAAEIAEALAPVSLGDLNLAAGDSVVGGFTPVETAPQEIIFESTQVDEAPEVVTKTPPVYPHAAREQGIEGYVAVKLLVDADGSVRQVNILKSKPEGVFDEAVGQAAAGWMFKPGKIGGKPVPTWVTTTLQFRLN